MHPQCNTNKLPRTCEHCGHTFLVPRWRLAAGSACRFCSIACFRAFVRSEQRFWAKVVIGHPSECWEWQGARFRTGYGRLSYNASEVSAHRMAYRLTHGPIPPGMMVCHSCDNPPCVNPAHLSLGSCKDNLREASSKGRMGGEHSHAHLHPESRQGERNGRAKLTAAQITEIRELLAKGLRPTAIAPQFGVSPSTIGRIRSCKSWSHL
jgi:hypothetical protein